MTFNENDVNRRGKGVGGGQFDTKQNSAPIGGLAELDLRRFEAELDTRSMLKREALQRAQVEFEIAEAQFKAAVLRRIYPDAATAVYDWDGDGDMRLTGLRDEAGKPLSIDDDLSSFDLDDTFPGSIRANRDGEEWLVDLRGPAMTEPDYLEVSQLLTDEVQRVSGRPPNEFRDETPEELANWTTQNAQRIYSAMRERGWEPDSVTRECLFRQASYVSGTSYDSIYNSWLNETPFVAEPEPRRAGRPSAMWVAGMGHWDEQAPLTKR